MATANETRRIPLLVKVLYSAYLAVLVPYYWNAYGPTNFLYFCDVALLVTAYSLWTERPLWASAATVGILLPQTYWAIDFLAGLAGYPLTGMTDYMFNPSLSFVARGLSFFHFWLPFFLLWMVYRLGYDRRAFWTWTVLAWSLLLVCFFFLPPPPAPSSNPNLPVNVNYVYGMSDKAAQTWLPANAYFSLLLIALPTLIFLPTHLVLRRFLPAAEQRASP